MTQIRGTHIIGAKGQIEGCSIRFINRKGTACKQSKRERFQRRIFKQNWIDDFDYHYQPTCTPPPPPPPPKKKKKHNNNYLRKSGLGTFILPYFTALRNKLVSIPLCTYLYTLQRKPTAGPNGRSSLRVMKTVIKNASDIATIQETSGLVVVMLTCMVLKHRK